MKKRILTWVLVLAIVISMAPAALAAGHPFTDVPSGSWYEDYVSYVYQNDLMKGVSGTAFAPKTTMSRAMLVTVLYRIAGEPGTGGHPFTDVAPGKWYAEPIAWAYENGVVMGTTATRFSPDAQVTREQMVTIFYRFAGNLGLDVYMRDNLTAYRDRSSVDSYALEAFQWAVAAGIIAGVDQTHLAPDDHATRAQCAAIIQRFDLWAKGERPEYPDPDQHWDTRPSYNKGTSRNLEGSPYVLVIFLDDDESSWTEDEIVEFCDEKLTPGLDYLEQKAGEWNVVLDFQTGYYSSDSIGRDLRYDGIIGANATGVDYSTDVLEQVAATLGYGTKENMHRKMQEFAGEEEILYLVAANKDGLSYSMCDSENDGLDYMEYCMLYPDFPDYAYETPASTVAHEILHLFGAEDYYDPYGDFPQREALAQELYYYDIMLRVYTDISYNELGDVTAYSVGWTEDVPEVCLNDAWWN